MSASNSQNSSAKRWNLSFDTWAVLLAVLAALLIRVGVLKHVPW
ncbi:MAG TPA: hypothetical protein VJP87_00470 [Candidatus Acidoferrales bacterium]|nr:hypothetical protein [Candidatus Acidoferrales bacterium]